jgi:galactokinase/mevalonate kinase-like predicted kinase
MPSIDTLVASVVRQVRTTWSPAEIDVGVAVSWAMGAAAEGGAVSGAGGGGGFFFLQPATASRTIIKTAGTRKRWRRFNSILLPKIVLAFAGWAENALV